MNKLNSILFFIALVAGTARAENPMEAKIPYPEVNKDSWVMIELWPDVKDITFSSFFLDFSFEKNKNLCAVAKRIFDSEQEARSKKSGKKFSSQRLCLSVSEAVSQKYIRPK